GSNHEDANERIEKVLKIVDLFHIPNITQDQVMLRAFLMSLTGAASRWLRNKPSGSITTWEDLKTKTRSTETSDGLETIQAQLNNLGREIKKVNEKVYAAQVGCEKLKGPHYTKDCPLKKKVKPLKKPTTLNLVDLSKEGDIEQQLQDSTRGTVQTLYTKNEGNL
nr:hypothetical protein [Tanacetum cinerariifolium]